MVKETITKNGKNIFRNKDHSKYLNDTRTLLQAKEKLEREKRLVTKNLKKTNEEIKKLNNWFLQLEV